METCRHTEASVSPQVPAALNRFSGAQHHARPDLTALSRLAAGLALTVGLASAAQAEDGEVKKIDPEASKITLKHNGIKNLDMPAMQMAFRVSDPAGSKPFRWATR